MPDNFAMNHYIMWLTISTIPMTIYYFTIGLQIDNPLLRFLIGFLMMEFVLLIVSPIVEQKPLSSVFWVNE